MLGDDDVCITARPGDLLNNRDRNIWYIETKFCLQGCPDGHNHVAVAHNMATTTEQSFRSSTWRWDGHTHGPWAGKKYHTILQYIFGYHDIRYFASIAIFYINALYRTVLMYTQTVISIEDSIIDEIVRVDYNCRRPGCSILANPFPNSHPYKSTTLDTISCRPSSLYPSSFQSCHLGTHLLSHEGEQDVFHLGEDVSNPGSHLCHLQVNLAFIDWLC